MAKSKTPMMEQYDKIKENHPDSILFFRMGDFYEMFGEDAVICSRTLGLTLTSRSKGDNAMPMAGVPYHSVDKYLEGMIKAGYRVAICDQMADPSTVKGIVPRGVTRIVTPGTVLEDSSLESTANNYLAAVVIKKDKAGIAWVDLSTGELFLEEVEAKSAFDNLECISPSETLVAERDYDKNPSIYEDMQGRKLGLVTRHPDFDFSEENAIKIIMEQYKVSTLDGFGLGKTDLSLCAAAPLLKYLNETQKGKIRHLRPPKKVNRAQELLLDRASVRNLELVEPILGANKKATLFHSINMTCTGAGGRLLRKWMLRPLRSVEKINARQQAIKTFMADHLLRSSLREILSRISDIERIMARVGCLRANARDLSALGTTLAVFPEIIEIIENIPVLLIERVMEKISGLEELGTKLTRSITSSPPVNITEGGIFRTGVNAELDELRSISSGGKEWIASFQAAEIERTGISSLKVKFNKVFGYYIEVTKTNLSQVPDNYERKQTLVNAERFITPELKKYEEKVLGAEGKIVELEYKLFCDLREEVASYTKVIQEAATAVSALDVYCALAEKSVSSSYVFPQIDESKNLEIINGRHPVVEQVIDEGKFVPNDCVMGNDSRVAIITGPNMSGKSTYIRQAALLIILAQMGSPIPANSAHIGLVDKVFTRVGAADDLARGQSTFMVEMSESANIMNNATEHSFIVLDEVGRGTSTFDGVSLAWALTEHIHNDIGARCIFATHYHELAELGNILDGAKNFNVAVRDWQGEIIFLHKIETGSADKSYGIHVARLAGIPKPVISRAQSILEGLEEQAIERDSSILKENQALRAAAKNVQLTLFDDPDRDSICTELANVNIQKLSPEDALEILKSMNAKAAHWRSSL